MADSKKGDYIVGKYRPPVASRFKPGQSGNPKGREKGSKNFATEFQDELNSRISIVENGKRKRITKRRAIVKQVTNKAVTGDLKSAPIIFNEARALENRESGVPPQAILETPADQLLMADIVKRVLLFAEAEQQQKAAPAELPPSESDAEANTESSEGKPE